MRKFGVEVEFGGSKASAINALHAAGLSNSLSEHGYFGHSDSTWVVKNDGSVTAGGEMVSPPLDFDDPEQRGQVTKAVDAIRRAGCTTYEPAGIHIHIESRDLTAEQVAAVARCFAKFEDVLYRLASSGWRSLRSGARSYCKPLTAEQIAGLAKAKTERQVLKAYYGSENANTTQHSNNARYCGLNLHSHFYRGTIEFRIFNSSMNPERIQAYIAVCMAIVEDARRGNKRSVSKAFKLGGMYHGTTNPESAYHRFQQIVRYEAGMDMADYKLMNKCWKDSRPQPPIYTY